ncbi:hypothetical protein HKBW3S42_00420 [Candidatus Hakubella thermalkaliphila]|uniref:HTH HARE-type domain-containing protein n=1 Tax=Candidatus Hakubella thermalkaliphila TaxID=2754717 RepID=A0A6V8P682_9ACTN
MSLSFLDAAYEILKIENRPLSSKDIALKAIKVGILKTKGKTPGVSINVCLHTDIYNKGVRNNYWEFYQKRMRLSDDKILRSVHKHEREIKAFLNGKLPGDTGYEQICQWIHFCYLLEMYWEGKELFKMLSEDEIPEGPYNWAKKLAEACELKVRT